jgi:hypothetical protein
VVLRRHIGAEHLWTATERGRRGCMVMLIGTLLIVVALIVMGLIFGWAG